jgi:hypothetical protein
MSYATRSKTQAVAQMFPPALNLLEETSELELEETEATQQGHTDTQDGDTDTQQEPESTYVVCWFSISCTKA